MGVGRGAEVRLEGAAKAEASFQRVKEEGARRKMGAATQQGPDSVEKCLARSASYPRQSGHANSGERATHFKEAALTSLKLQPFRGFSFPSFQSAAQPEALRAWPAQFPAEKGPFAARPALSYKLWEPKALIDRSIDRSIVRPGDVPEESRTACKS